MTNVKKLIAVTPKIRAYFTEIGQELESTYSHLPFKAKNFDIGRYMYCGGHVWIAHRDDKILGSILGSLGRAALDPTLKVLYQDQLYVKKSSGRAVYLLMKEFIDYGRANANLVFTCRGKYTNLKGSSLERLGFQETETLYHLEVK